MLGGGITGASAFARHAPILARRFRVTRLQTLNVDCALHKRPLPPNYSIRLESRAMAASLDAIGLADPVCIVGHSLGALVALTFALNHRKRVRGLVLSEPPAFWVMPPDEARASTETREILDLLRHLGPASSPSDDHLVAFLRRLGAPDPSPPHVAEPHRSTWVVQRACLRGLRAIGEHRDDLSRLRSFDKPVLIVTGTHTTAFHRRINDILADAFPKAVRAELPGGHGAAIHEAAAFAGIVRRFCRDPNLRD